VLDSLGRPANEQPGDKSTNANQDERENAPGKLQDRTGELSPETLDVMNREFVPLVEAGYDQAHERNPNLRGMLAISLELAGAEELGTIIESAEPAPERTRARGAPALPSTSLSMGMSVCLL
jgi:hypothetical protein